MGSCAVKYSSEPLAGTTERYTTCFLGEIDLAGDGQTEQIRSVAWESDAPGYEIGYTPVIRHEEMESTYGGYVFELIKPQTSVRQLSRGVFNFRFQVGSFAITPDGAKKEIASIFIFVDPANNAFTSALHFVGEPVSMLHNVENLAVGK